MEKCPRSVHRDFKTAASSWSHSTVVLVDEMTGRTFYTKPENCYLGSLGSFDTLIAWRLGFMLLLAYDVITTMPISL